MGNGGGRGHAHSIVEIVDTSATEGSERRQRKITAQVAPDVRGVGLATGAGHDDRGVAAPTNVAGAGDGTLVWCTVTPAAAVAMAAREAREVEARDSVLSPRTLNLGV